MYHVNSVSSGSCSPSNSCSRGLWPVSFYLTCSGRWTGGSCESLYVRLQGLRPNMWRWLAQMWHLQVASPTFLCDKHDETQYQILWSKNSDFGFKMVALTFSWVHDCIVKQCGHTPCCPWNKQTSEMTAHHREYARIIKRHWSRRGVGLRRKEHFHLQHKNRFDQVTASTGVFLKADVTLETICHQSRIGANSANCKLEIKPDWIQEAKPEQRETPAGQGGSLLLFSGIF